MHRGAQGRPPPPLLRHYRFATARALLQLISSYGLRLACGVASAGAHVRAAHFLLKSMSALFVFSLVIAMTSARINGLLRLQPAMRKWRRKISTYALNHDC